MKFRKKPIVVEAERFELPALGGLTEHLKKLDVYMVSDKLAGGKSTYYYIHTLEGDMFLKPGDWIITGVKGERYPCKPDIFEQTYEKV